MMEETKVRFNRMPQIYGYLVCLVTVITFLISVTTLINAVIDLGDPMHAGWISPGSPSLASYNNYKMDILKSQTEKDTSKSSFTPDDKTLREMYESAKADRIQSQKHMANKSIIVSSILIIFCIILFSTHWMWMRKLAKAEKTGSVQ
jgi:hypothetical protein